MHDAYWLAVFAFIYDALESNSSPLKAIDGERDDNLRVNMRGILRK